MVMAMQTGDRLLRMGVIIPVTMAVAGVIVVVAMIVIMAIMIIMVVDMVRPVSFVIMVVATARALGRLRYGSSRRLAGNEGELVAKPRHPPSNRWSDRLILGMSHGHCSGRNRHRDVLDPINPPHRRVDLCRAGGAIHTIDAIAALLHCVRHDQSSS